MTTNLILVEGDVLKVPYVHYMKSCNKSIEFFQKRWDVYELKNHHPRQEMY
jgi:hypothetical protein